METVSSRKQNETRGSKDSVKFQIEKDTARTVQGRRQPRTVRAGTGLEQAQARAGIG